MSRLRFAEGAAMTVTLLGRSGDTFEASIRAQSFAPGIDLASRWVGIHELERELFESSACFDGSADLVLVPADWLPRLASTGAIRPLDSLVANDPPDGWPGGWSSAFTGVVTFECASDSRSAVWGLPFHDGPPLLIYRRDLYESTDERRKYRALFDEDLVPARTWSEFDRQAAWFTRPIDDLYGTVFAAAPDGHNNVYDFVTQLRIRGGDVLIDGRPGFGGAAGLDSLAFLRRHLIETPTVTPRAAILDSVGSGAEFASGRVALMMNWAGYAHSAEREGSAVRGRVGTALAPTADDGAPTPVVNAFWALAVTAGSRAAVEQEVWSVVRECLSSRGDLATTEAGSSGTRLSTWTDPSILAHSPTFGLFAQAHEHSRPLPQVVQLPLLVDLLNTLLDRVLNRGEPAEEALDEALSATDRLLAVDSADV